MVYYAAFRALGLQGILFTYFTVLVIIFAGVYYRSCRAGADCKDAAIVTLAAVCLGGVSIAPRTLLFGWLCMIALLLTLDSFRRTGKGLWLLPPLFALWINLHGSWVFGLAVLVLTIVSGLLQGEFGLVMARKWTAGELRKLLFALGASVAALFLNPFGYKLVLYPYDLLLRQEGVMQYIQEWQPVNFSTFNGKLALAVIFALLIAALFSSRPWRLDEVLLTAFALWAGLSHVRFLFFVGLILAPILAPRLHLFPPYEPDLDKPWLNAVVIMGITGALIWFFPTAAALQQKVDSEYPNGALQYVQQQHLKGRIFNQYKWGGYIEWNAPELKTFIDGRADIFIFNGVFKDFLKATALQHSYEILDKYDIKYVLLPPGEPLSYLLAHSSTWRPLYTDHVAALFERIPNPAKNERN